MLNYPGQQVGGELTAFLDERIEAPVDVVPHDYSLGDALDDLIHGNGEDVYGDDLYEMQTELEYLKEEYGDDYPLVRFWFD